MPSSTLCLGRCFKKFKARCRIYRRESAASCIICWGILNTVRLCVELCGHYVQCHGAYGQVAELSDGKQWGITFEVCVCDAVAVHPAVRQRCGCLWSLGHSAPGLWGSAGVSLSRQAGERDWGLSEARGVQNGPFMAWGSALPLPARLGGGSQVQCKAAWKRVRVCILLL